MRDSVKVNTIVSYAIALSSILSPATLAGMMFNSSMTGFQPVRMGANPITRPYDGKPRGEERICKIF